MQGGTGVRLGQRCASPRPSAATATAAWVLAARAPPAAALHPCAAVATAPSPPRHPCHHAAPHEAAWGCSRLHTPLGLVPLHWISPCALPPPPATPLLGRGGSEQAAQQAQGGSEVGPQPVGGLAFSPARRPAATHAASNDGAGCRWLAGEGCGEAACWEQQRAVARWERRLRARLHAAAALQPRAGRAAGPSVESIMQWHS